MNLVIMQPYLFPYVGYFQLLTAADRFVVYDDVQFIKGGWINRNQLLVNGQPWMFTVPLDQPSPNRLIRDIELRPRDLWQPKLLQTISQNYRRAPHYEPVFELIKQIFEADARTIADLVRNSLQQIVQYLNLPVQLIPSSDIYNNAHLRAQARVVDICQQEGATCYINAMGGRALYDGETFQQAGISLKFIQPELPPYPQQVKNGEFVPGLSIVDALMHNSKPEIHSLLQSYSLRAAEG
ncbi:WbqC family protein [Hymenobacter segetis]|uniref:WbqC family protein n=1 Tax=Hymenobacter segetis TaxID=2025509 RepID=A0ABU9LY64_9BACT